MAGVMQEVAISLPGHIRSRLLQKGTLSISKEGYLTVTFHNPVGPVDDLIEMLAENVRLQINFRYITRAARLFLRRRY